MPTSCQVDSLHSTVKKNCPKGILQFDCQRKTITVVSFLLLLLLWNETSIKTLFVGYWNGDYYANFE